MVEKLKKENLLRRVAKITTYGKEKKRDGEETHIHNILSVMQKWGMSYEEVMHLPLPAKNEMVLYLIDEQEEADRKDREKKMKSIKKGPGGLNG